MCAVLYWYDREWLTLGEIINVKRQFRVWWGTLKKLLFKALEWGDKGKKKMSVE